MAIKAIAMDTAVAGAIAPWLRANHILGRSSVGLSGTTCALRQNLIMTARI